MKVQKLIDLLSELNPNDEVVLDLQDQWAEDLYDFTTDVIAASLYTDEVRLVPKPFKTIEYEQ